MILPLRAKLTLLAVVVALGVGGAVLLLPGLERTVTQIQHAAHSRDGLAGAFLSNALGSHRPTDRRRTHTAHAANGRRTSARHPSHHVAGRHPNRTRPAASRNHPGSAADGSGDAWWMLLAALLAVPTIGLASIAARLGSRRRRVYWRYRILPSGHDHPSAEQVVRAIGTMGATVSEPASSRVWRGQPVFGLQLDYDPQDGGRLVPWLVCERRHAHALDGALQQAYRNVSVELHAGEPLPAADRWRPASVVRLRKSRDPIYPLYGSPQAAGLGPPLNSAGVMLHSMCRPLPDRAGSRGSVRVMVLPADRTAAYLRERHRRAEKRSQLAVQLEQGRWAPQSSVDAQQARQSAQMAEHAMFHVEVQIASEDFATCKSLAGALLDYPGLNALKRRQLGLRAGLYRRRWAGFAPPLVMRGSRKLMSAAELAYLVRLPSGALSVPFAQAREPRLPANGGARTAAPAATITAGTDPAADRAETCGPQNGHLQRARERGHARESQLLRPSGARTPAIVEEA